MENSPLDPVYPNAKSTSSYQDGMEFQDFACAALAKHGVILQNLSSRKWQYKLGENLQGFEIKQDNHCSTTQRLSIEVAEKSNASDRLPWTPSGIMRSDNSWLYIQGNRTILFVFAKNWLRRYYSEKNPPVTEKMGTIKTFYLPFSQARTYAAKVFAFDSHEDLA